MRSLRVASLLLLLLASSKSTLIAQQQPATIAEFSQALVSPDEPTRLRAIDAIAEFGPAAAGAVPMLTKFLENPSPATRAHAAYALGRIGEASKVAAPGLAKALTDPDRSVRRAALAALKTIKPGPQIMLPLMGKLLGDAEPEVAVRALDALAEAGEEAIPVLIAALSDNKTRYWACLALGEMGPKAKDALPSLTNALADNRPEVLREVLLCMGHIGPDAKALPAITAQLDNKDDSVKEAAAFALAMMGAEAASALPKLQQNFNSTNELLQTITAWALVRIQPNNTAALDKSLPVLVQSLTRKDAAVRTVAMRALLDLRPGPERVLPILHGILDKADPAQLNEALDALATIGEPALPGIKLALKRPESQMRAVVILGRMGPTAAGAVPELLEVFQNPMASIALRRETAHTLGAIGPAAATAVPALAAALEDHDTRLRHNAGIALGRIGKPAASAAPALEKALALPDDEYMTLVSAWALLKVQPDDVKLRARTIPLIAKALGDSEPTVRRGAAEALGALGAEAKVAVPNLQKLLQDPDPSVREAATAALAKIGG